MSGEVRVRPLEESDVDAVHALERAIFPNPWRREHFDGLLGLERASPWVAEADGTVVGYAIGWVVADEAELANVAVAEPARCRGIGGRLLDAVERAVARRGGRRVYLEVREGNAAARAFYEGRGYIALGRRPGYYSHPREDAITMVHELPVARRLTPRRGGS